MQRPATEAARRLALLVATIALCAVSMIVAGPQGSYDTMISVFLGVTWCAFVLWLLESPWVAILAPGSLKVVLALTCAAGVFSTVMAGLAAPALALKWRGERQLVTVVSKSGEAAHIRTTEVTEYHYQLATSVGKTVRPGLVGSADRFQVGDRLWVTADSWGLIEPVLDDEVTKLPAELIGLGFGFVVSVVGGCSVLGLDSAGARRRREVAVQYSRSELPKPD